MAFKLLPNDLVHELREQSTKYLLSVQHVPVDTQLQTGAKNSPWMWYYLAIVIFFQEIIKTVLSSDLYE